MVIAQSGLFSYGIPSDIIVETTRCNGLVFLPERMLLHKNYTFFIVLKLENKSDFLFLFCFFFGGVDGGRGGGGGPHTLTITFSGFS